MGRHSLTSAQSLRTRFYYEIIKWNCSLSEGQMDMQFCDPLLIRPYHERRRIFNRMKVGLMPYRGAKREEFINRVAKYGRLNFTADLYNSEFWNIIDLQHTAEANDLFILKCINKIGLSSGLVINAAFSAAHDHVNLSTNSKQSQQSFNSSQNDLIEYEDALNNLLFNQTNSLDAVAFIAALYRDSIYNGRIDAARKLREYYSVNLVNICGRYNVSPPLINELINVSVNNVLKIGPNIKSTLVDRLNENANLLKDPVNIYLEYFLELHQSI